MSPKVLATSVPDAAAPVVATGRGGSGTRLLSLALQELGVFLGNRLNETQDSVEWVDCIYSRSIAALSGDAPAVTNEEDLLRCAERILGLAERPPGLWGWKLPETMLILPSVVRAFPRARFVHLVRHPLDACLRRTHMTSRLDNPIGRATLDAAYAWLGRDTPPAEDPDHVRNAVSWAYQLTAAHAFTAAQPTGRVLTLRYEDLCDDPQEGSDRLAGFIGAGRVPTRLGEAVDPSRRRQWERVDSRVEEVWSICRHTAGLLGYRFDSDHGGETVDREG